LKELKHKLVHKQIFYDAVVAKLLMAGGNIKIQKQNEREFKKEWRLILAHL
jgi:hypothetical protein